MKQSPILSLLVLITSINISVAMEKYTSDSDDKDFFLDPKEIPSQYHPIGLGKQEYQKAKLALLYSWIHKNGKNKHQRANYRASQKYLNTLFKEQFKAKLSDDESETQDKYPSPSETSDSDISESDALDQPIPSFSSDSMDDDEFLEQLGALAGVFNKQSDSEDEVSDQIPVAPSPNNTPNKKLKIKMAIGSQR